MYIFTYIYIYAMDTLSRNVSFLCIYFERWAHPVYFIVGCDCLAFRSAARASEGHDTYHLDIQNKTNRFEVYIRF